MRKYLPENPNILALPLTFKVGAVHLSMKNDVYDGTNGHAGDFTLMH